MDAQRRAADFVATHGLEAPPAYRAQDLTAEVGEVTKELAVSTAYGASDDVTVAPDEIGDALFALLALAETVEIDAGAALEASLEKCEARLEATGDAGSR